MLDNKDESLRQRHICCICGRSFKGFGNNPAPVMNEGVCCEGCNLLYVIPERYKEMIRAFLNDNDDEIDEQDNGD